MHVDRRVTHNNVSNHLRDLAISQPEALAVVVAGAAGYVELNARELDLACDAACRALLSLGIGKATRVALMVPPSPEFFALTFALFRLEAVPVLVDPGLGVRNVKQALLEAKPEVFIGVVKAQVARRLLGWCKGSLRDVVTVGGSGWLFGGSSLTRLLASSKTNAEVALPNSAREQEAAVLFTSGSTGPPKGASYSHGMFSAQVDVLRQEYGIEAGERDLATFPLFALFGPALGMAAVVPDMDTGRPASADPRKLMDAALDYGCTNLFASPALIDKLGRYCESKGVRLSSLRRAISAGAPMGATALRRFVDSALEPGVELFTPYGMTECLPATSIGSREILEQTLEVTERGGGVCVGRPVGDVEVKVIEITDEPMEEITEATEVALGEIGELVVRGSVVSTHYVERPEANRLHKMSDRGSVWHRTGDVGRFDEVGRIWMCGRKAHRVDTATGRLFSVPCEAVFNCHPAVRRSALVGVPDGAATVEGRIHTTPSETPVICVELESERRAPGRAAPTLVADLLELGSQYEHTKDIREVLIHPGFPVDVRHNAKIFREKVRQWAMRRLA